MGEAGTGNGGERWGRWAADYLGMAVALAALVAYFGLSTDHFFSATNFRTIANQIPAAIIVAVGMTFVLIAGGIDLSVGSVLALSGAAFGACLVRWQLPLGVAAMACLATGLFCGIVNGWIVARWRLPSFIVTLGMLEAARGGAYLVTDSQTQYVGEQVRVITEASLLGLSLPFVVAMATVALGEGALRLTLFGRYTMATGYNEQVVRLAGVNTSRVRLAVFALCGLLTGVAAVVHTARISAADPNAGLGFELEAIAAVVIGGTSLSGGRGSVLRTLFGVLIIAVLGNGLVHAEVREPVKRLLTGAVVVAAVIVDRYRQSSRA